VTVDEVVPVEALLGQIKRIASDGRAVPARPLHRRAKMWIPDRQVIRRGYGVAQIGFVESVVREN
jgi:hypothetical protein